MASLSALIIALVAIIGVTSSQNLISEESLDISEEIDPGYRPWDSNDTSTTWISLEGMGIGSISSLFRLSIPNLKWLILDGNNIQRIPSGTFKFLSNLTYISLAKNQINNIESDAFIYLEKLRVLDLDRNTIYQSLNLNPFSTLPALKRLYLRNCQLSSFDLPLHTGNLSHLYLSGNQLQMFYAGSESTLTHLYLNGNQLTYVSLSQMKSLIHLDLGSNRLNKIMRNSEVPPAYYARHFRNGYNNFARDDTALYLEDAPALQYLIVSSNLLKTIEPDTFLGTELLVFVDLTGNQISEVSAGTFNHLLELEDILLDSNKITQINHRAFVNLPNLKTISLKDNLINDIDEDAFTKLNSSANEVFLFLDNNEIHTLRKGSFKDIKGLKHIGLSGNRIKTISAQAFVNLPNLDSIVIENQSRDQSLDRYRHSQRFYQTTQIPVPLKKGLIESDAFFDLSNLTVITIRGNLFTDIEAKAFHDLPKLTLLDLSNNSIKALSSEAFYDLPVIEHLNLGNNLISEIEHQTFPKQLKYLNLAWNPVCPDVSCLHVEELHQLEELDVSGIIERLKMENFAEFSANLTIIVGKAELPKSSSPVPCYY